MTRPIRIQRKRTKGWKMPESTVSVCRPGKWGNPFIVSEKVRPGARSGTSYFCVPTAQDAVDCYREMMGLDGETAEALRASLHELEGKNLACFCPLNQPCHADVLLELANQSITQPQSASEPTS